MNAESGGRLCPAMRENHALPRAIPKPPQCALNATSMRVASQAVATPKPPQSAYKATLMRPQSSHKAPTKRQQSLESDRGLRTTGHLKAKAEGRTSDSIWGRTAWPLTRHRSANWTCQTPTTSAFSAWLRLGRWIVSLRPMPSPPRCTSNPLVNRPRAGRAWGRCGRDGSSRAL